MSRLSTVNSSPQACLNCRSKHLRCDGARPCFRCSTTQVECVFVRSRRGMVGGRRKQTLPDATAEAKRPVPPATFQISPEEIYSPQQQKPVQLSANTTLYEQPYTNPDDHTIDLYYRSIHPAHPFIVPQKRYREDPSILPSHLKDAIGFITSSIVGTSRIDDDIASRLLKRALPLDVYTVQTCIVLTIASYARCERELGNEALLKAIDVAYKIGLQNETFGSHDDPVLQESWRRTWWELYCINGLIALLTPSTKRILTVWERSLPGDDCDYAMLNIAAETCTLDDMQDRIIADDGLAYSSFAYRVEAVRILNDVLDLENSTTDSSLGFTAINATIQSFLLSMPDLSPGLATDEMRCCSLMTINLASLVLHLPRSGLKEIHNFQTICSTDTHTTASSADQASHQSAALAAADAITRLLIARDVSAGSMKTISPCFSCALAFSTTVQLANYVLLGIKDNKSKAEQRHLKEYVQVSLSALDVMGRTWKVAQLVKGQLSAYAKELLTESRRIRRPAMFTPVSMNEPIAPPDKLEFDVDFKAYSTPQAFENFSSEDEVWLESLVNDPINFQFMFGSQVGNPSI